MRRIALVSARVARAQDLDLPPLQQALEQAGAQVDVLDWDDSNVSWSQYEQAVLRSTWDYAERLPEFLHWATQTAKLTRLRNDPAVVRWNIDKHYLGELAALGVATVPSVFVEPGDSAEIKLQSFRSQHPSPEYVVKPAVGAGSRDAARYQDSQQAIAIAHIERLLHAGRSVLLQPYLARVDEAGETALLFFNGVFSHAIRKGPLLQPHAGPTELLFALEDIRPRMATATEQKLAEQVLQAMHRVPALQALMPLPYARVDLLLDENGQPCVLELELTEPSTFLAQSEGAAARFAAALLST